MADAGRETQTQETNPQGELLDNVVQLMKSAMEQQEERLMKALEVRDANDRRREKINEPDVRSLGDTGNAIRMEDLVASNMKYSERARAYKNFLCSKPPEFSGTDSPVACLNWIQEMEQAIDTSECEEGQKVKFASSMMRGRALTWWNVTKTIMGTATALSLTWDAFKKEVLDEYCNERAIDRIEDEFRALKKRDMSVREYSNLLLEKLDLVGHIVPSEKDRVKAYMNGLPTAMKVMVRCSKAYTLREAIEESQFLEDVHSRGKEEEAEFSEKRKWEDRRSPPHEYQIYEEGRRISHRRKSKWCRECRSKHAGMCNPNHSTCLKCGMLGHSHRDCSIKGTICFACRKSGHV
ncbi:hypothetical protein L6452_09496 [Arctium lappa]|uniref:Uncharacterized protein n=1 Tax=Arctium lappa TaxID=4217 RepID=A0ACB9DK68_ARCLA|nr:hypothetical protein L6452_09496 [Arctium lappa]